MKLHRVKLMNFRGVECREVTFAENGVTIVEGPNEVGRQLSPKGFNLLSTCLTLLRRQR